MERGTRERCLSMKALVLDESATLSLRDQPVPGYDGECLIRVRMAGICGTDLQLLEGYAGFSGIPGHEFVGVVESAGAAEDRQWIGKRVAGEINIGCGKCQFCAAGVREHCSNRSVLGIRGRGGAFAEYVTLPASNLHAIPDSLPDRSAVFVEPVAACCRIFEQMDVPADAEVAVLGDGRMGLLVAQVLKTATPNVVVLGRHEPKLTVARTLGLDARLATAAPSSDLFDIVVDVTGRSAGFRDAVKLVKPRGTLVLKSTFHGEAPVETWSIVVDEVTLVGSRCGPFDPAIALLASGAVQVDPLIARITQLEDFERAFREARSALKVLFELAPHGT
jgi:threonine dehydrogenase-like Zn-dependent dehydrogenase